MARLRSARMTDETLVSKIDDFVGELEVDVCTILGFTPDADVTANSLKFDNSGRLTSQLVAWRVVANLANSGGDGSGHAALEITDTFDSSRAYVGLFGIDMDNSGSPQAKAVFVIGYGFSEASEGAGDIYDQESSFPGLAMILGTGADLLPYNWLIGRLSDEDGSGFVRPLTNVASVFYNQDGSWGTPGRPAVVALRTNAASHAGGTNTTFTAGTSELLDWDSEVLTNSAITHVAGGSESTITTDGEYLFGVQVKFAPETLDAGSVTVKLWRDRSSTDTQFGEVHTKYDETAGISTIQADGIVDCLAGDKLYAECIYDNGGIGGFYSVAAGVDDASFYVARIR